MEHYVWLKKCVLQILVVRFWSMNHGSASGAGPLPQGSPEETILLRIVGKVPKHIDEIAKEAEITAQRAAAMLLELELRGLVNQLPGKYFIS